MTKEILQPTCNQSKKWSLQQSLKAPCLLVGTARFELTTSRTPSDFGRFVQIVKSAQSFLESTT